MALSQARLLLCCACLVSTTCAIGWHARAPPVAQNVVRSEARVLGKRDAAKISYLMNHPSSEGGDEGESGGEHPGEHAEGEAHGEHEEGEAHGEHEEGDAHGEHEKEGEANGEHVEGEAHGEHEEEGEAHGEHAKEHHGSAVILGIGMFCTIALLSMTVGLTSNSDPVISSHAWYVVDQVILIFVAVMSYQAFGALSEAWFETAHLKIFAAAFQAFALFLIAFFLSWKLKSEPVSLAIFCGGGAHFVAFASCHMSEVVGEEYAGEEHLWRKLGVFFVLAAIFFAFSAAVYFLKRHASMEDDNWNDKITDTENDFIAMALAVVWTTFVFHAIMGKDHELEVEPEEAHRIKHDEELTVFLYAFLLIPVAIMINKFLQARGESGSVLVTRLAMFVSSFASMACCWAFIFLGQMHFYSHFCGKRPLFCRLVFAMLASIVAAIAIVGFAQVARRGPGGTLERGIAVALSAFSLAAGWSWEQCFDAALEIIAEHFEHQVHHLKFMMTITLVCIILPTYVSYIKPVADQKTACLEG